MAKEFSSTPSIAEINEIVELAKKERNQYIAEGISSLISKLGAAFRSLFETAPSKPSPSH
ncbi:hypothetical protein GCM10011533_18170 [Streptosporangium jomthongense]|uniref:RSP_7527 family protein n=1 Tax=Marinobacter aromaticivorans TaxID=1494078 RepID=A0ABW2IUJ7_9GAMM|nr:hypothetical protein [Marinobacter aromaticivorans]GGE66279.1 hypothetical protein GCM10011533_18170 [Streptosporangium jomthongense]